MSVFVHPIDPKESEVQQEHTRPPYEKMSPKQLVKLFGGTKSAAIRGLSAEGFSTGDIARMLSIIYQHARNVLVRPLKRQMKRRP